jgi:hypothetical protein
MAEMCSKTVLAASYTLDHEAKLILRTNSSIAADEDKTVSHMHDLLKTDFIIVYYCDRFRVWGLL